MMIDGDIWQKESALIPINADSHQSLFWLPPADNITIADNAKTIIHIAIWIDDDNNITDNSITDLIIHIIIFTISKIDLIVIAIIPSQKIFADGNLIIFCHRELGMICNSKSSIITSP